MLKVTNDIECFKFASDNVADVKNIDRLAGWFLSQSSRKEVMKPSTAAGIRRCDPVLPRAVSRHGCQVVCGCAVVWLCGGDVVVW